MTTTPRHALSVALLASITLLSACGQSEPDTDGADSMHLGSVALSAEATQAMADYERDGQAFVTALNNGATAEELIPQAQSLLDKAVQVSGEYMNIFPGCKDHLTGALQIETQWKTLTPEQIEVGYHEGEALPPEPTGSNCYHMKDVIVHPATALALLHQDTVDRDQVLAEIAEVIAHATVVRTGVGYNSGDGD